MDIKSEFVNVNYHCSRFTLVFSSQVESLVFNDHYSIDANVNCIFDNVNIYSSVNVCKFSGDVRTNYEFIGLDDSFVFSKRSNSCCYGSINFSNYSSNYLGMENYDEGICSVVNNEINLISTVANDNCLEYDVGVTISLTGFVDSSNLFVFSNSFDFNSLKLNWIRTGYDYISSDMCGSICKYGYGFISGMSNNSCVELVSNVSNIICDEFNALFDLTGMVNQLCNFETNVFKINYSVNNVEVNDDSYIVAFNAVNFAFLENGLKVPKFTTTDISFGTISIKESIFNFDVNNYSFNNNVSANFCGLFVNNFDGGEMSVI